MRTRSFGSKRLVGRPFGALATAIAACLLAGGTAQAITFDMVYRGPNSADPHGDALHHAADPDGSQLIAHMTEAANRWSDIVLDDYTMTIEYYYSDESGTPGTTATADTLQSIKHNSPTNNRTKVGRVVFYNERDLWFDPTPEDDSEYTFEQTIIHDLTTPERAEQLVGNPDSLAGLELGYVGQRNVGGDGTDLLRSAMHEIGHLMGITHRLDRGSEETLDSDWDLRSIFLGSDLALRSGLGGTPGQSYHVASPYPLNGPFAVSGRERKLISVPDVLAASTVSQWNDIQLPRKILVTPRGQSTDWSASSNWAGGNTPRPDDEAYLRNGARTFVMTSTEVENLLIDYDSELFVNAPQFVIDENLTIGQDRAGNLYEARVTVGAGATMYVHHVDLLSGWLKLAEGEVRTSTGQFNNQGLVWGRGELTMASDFINHGTIRADDGDIFIQGALAANPIADLGPDSTSVVEAYDGDIRLLINNASVFHGRMSISNGHAVDMRAAWGLSSQGRLNLHGGASTAATLRGADLTVNGGVVTVNGLGHFENAVFLQGGSELYVNETDDRAVFYDEVEFDTGLFGDVSGEGELDFRGSFFGDSGSVEVGTTYFRNTSVIDGTNYASDMIDGSSGQTTLKNGSLSFEQFAGKLRQEGGVLLSSLSQQVGDFTQTGGRVRFDLYSSDEYESLTVNGTAELDGQIEITLDDGFTPTGGELFHLFAADKLEIESLALVGLDSEGFEIIVVDDNVLVRAPLVGDFNHDGDVDAADYTIWRDGLPAADANYDNQIDEIDYTLWAENYGASAPSIGSVLAIPEPTTLAAALGALLLGAATTRPRGEAVFSFPALG